MPNKWTNFIQDYADKNNLSYMCALQVISNDPNKKGYEKQTKEGKKQELLLRVETFYKEYINGINKDKKNNNTEYIDKIRIRFKRFDDDFKKKLLKKYPEVYINIDTSNNNKIRKLMKRLEDVIYTYENEYNNISDALKNKVKIQRDTKKYMKDLYKEHLLLRDVLINKYNIRDLEELNSPKELGL